MSNSATTDENEQRGAQHSILQPGRNCWRIERAERAAFLIDGRDYFKAVREALKQARHCVYILGWDIDSRLRLTPDEPPDEFPDTLADFLRAVVERNPQLNIYVLSWDFAMLFALDREWWTPYKLNRFTSTRLHFHLDGRHPPGSSHHQKVVVVDDQVAFSGGLDLTKGRWDTPEHRPEDPYRVDTEGRAYRPYHDIQMAVSGAAAAALGELARLRWELATGEGLAPVGASDDGRLPWPDSVAADMHDVNVAVARTIPGFEDVSAVREVQHLYVDAIAAAQRYVYVENQYFTTGVVGNVIERRLREPDGPEFVLVLPLATDGWIAQHTMDVLRERLLRRLRAADEHDRLRVYYPHIPGLEHEPINVHSKIMVVDDRFLRVGSSNLNNRSMGLDTECDLAVEEAEDADVRSAITGFRDRLLAEHTGQPVSVVSRAIRTHESLIKAIESLPAEQRWLVPLGGNIAPEVDAWVPGPEIIDPSRPVDPERLKQRYVPGDRRRPAGRRLLAWSGFVLLLLALAAAWRFTPLSQLVDIERVAAAISVWKHSLWAPLALIGAYVVGGLVALPVTVLIVATVLTFGPGLGLTYALVGSAVSAAVTYSVGSMLGKRVVAGFAGPRIQRLNRRLARRGILTMVIVRNIPIAPFTVINLVAGASRIQFRDYIIGTILGMAPGTLALTLFVDRLEAAIRNPVTQNFVTLAGVALAISAGALALRKWILKRARSRKAGARDRVSST